MKRIAFLFLASFLLTGCNSPLNQVLKKYNFLAQVPPVAEHGPGNLVWKRGASSPSKLKAGSSISLGYICDPEFLKKEPAPIESDSESTTISKELGGQFSFTGAELAVAGVTSAASAVHKVDLKLENVKVVEYALETLDDIKESLGPKCRKILKKQSLKKNAYQVVSALKADVSYVITFKANISAELKLKFFKEIGSKLGMDLKSDKSSIGKGLFYGVELEPL